MSGATTLFTAHILKRELELLSGRGVNGNAEIVFHIQIKTNHSVLLEAALLPLSERGFPPALRTVLRQTKRGGTWVKWRLYPREFVCNTHSEVAFAFQFTLLRESQEAGKDLPGEQLR